MTQTRQPAGVPTGGRFTAQSHAEVDIVLTETVRSPGFPVQIPNSLFRAPHEPNRVTVYLQDPPPAPQSGCDWTDPTRDPDAQGDIDHKSWGEERHRNVGAVLTAASARIKTGAPAPRSVVHAIDDWNDWAKERWKATGDPYYPEFAAGLDAGRLALIAESVSGVTLRAPALNELERWTEDGTVDANVANQVSSKFSNGAPIDPDGVRRWVDAVELSSGGVTTGGQDGALMVGRLVGGVPAPAPD